MFHGNADRLPVAIGDWWPDKNGECGCLSYSGIWDKEEGGNYRPGFWTVASLQQKGGWLYRSYTWRPESEEGDCCRPQRDSAGVCIGTKAGPPNQMGEEGYGPGGSFCGTRTLPKKVWEGSGESRLCVSVFSAVSASKRDHSLHSAQKPSWERSRPSKTQRAAGLPAMGRDRAHFRMDPCVPTGGCAIGSFFGGL